MCHNIPLDNNLLESKDHFLIVVFPASSLVIDTVATKCTFVDRHPVFY